MLIADVVVYIFAFKVADSVSKFLYPSVCCGEGNVVFLRGIHPSRVLSKLES